MLAAALAAVLQVGAPPAPPIVDYFPGPWFWPVQGKADRLAPDFDVAVVRNAADMGTLAFDLCVERATGGAADARDRRLLERARRALAAGGVRDVRLSQARCPVSVPPREVAGLMLTPVPR